MEFPAFSASYFLVVRQILSQFSLANFIYTLNHKHDVMAYCRLADSGLGKCGDRNNLSLVESSQVPCSEKLLFQHSSLNKASETVKFRRTSLIQMQSSDISAVLFAYPRLKVHCKKYCWKLQRTQQWVAVSGSAWSILFMRQRDVGPRNWSP